MQEEERLRKHREEQERIAREKAEEKKGTPPSDFTNSIGMEFVQIPAGEFDMGSPASESGRSSDEGPVHRVKISNAFYMGKYEVTQKQWREVMGTKFSYFKGDNRPVETVSWNEVQEFIKKLNEKEGTGKYRLPSEAEWEYAARAGTTTRYSFGYGESELREYAWYYYNSCGETHEVGQKKPNLWGLYDMQGNVCEWVQDIITTATAAHLRTAVHGKEMAPTVSVGAVAGLTSPKTAGRRVATTSILAPPVSFCVAGSAMNGSTGMVATAANVSSTTTSSAFAF